MIKYSVTKNQVIFVSWIAVKAAFHVKILEIQQTCFCIHINRLTMKIFIKCVLSYFVIDWTTLDKTTSFLQLLHFLCFKTITRVTTIKP